MLQQNRSEATLVRDFTQLILKKFDLEFTVDPLFKKTSADFDEGGARGLLLNHLGVDRNCKIIFDASDAQLESTEENDDKDDKVLKEAAGTKSDGNKLTKEDEMDIDGKDQDNWKGDCNEYEGGEMIDITKLRCKHDLFAHA